MVTLEQVLDKIATEIITSAQSTFIYPVGVDFLFIVIILYLNPRCCF